MRRASIMGHKHALGSMLGFCNKASCANICKVGKVITGMPTPKHKPFTNDVPMRKPVYEPGPILKATASNCCGVYPTSLSTSWVKVPISLLWFCPFVSMRVALSWLFSQIATKHTSVDVSMSKIFAIVNGCATKLHIIIEK